MMLVSLILILLSAVPVATSTSVEERREVKCDVTLASDSLKPGASGEILLTFHPEEGIHINTEPAMEFDFTKTPSVHFDKITSMPKAPTTGYLDARRPVKYGFTVDKKSRKGMIVLKGTVRYYFCSDTEGWCNRFSQPFRLTLTVTR